MQVKKGSIPLDLIVVMLVFTVVLSMVVIIAYTLNSALITPFDDAGLNSTYLNQSKGALDIFNSGIPFIFFSFVILALMLAWMVRSSPMISIFIVFVVAVIGYIAMGMSNAFYQFSHNTEMTAAANEMGYVVYLVDNMGYVLLIVGIIITIFMFAKPKSFEV